MMAGGRLAGSTLAVLLVLMGAAVVMPGFDLDGPLWQRTLIALLLAVAVTVVPTLAAWPLLARAARAVAELEQRQRGQVLLPGQVDTMLERQLRIERAWLARRARATLAVASFVGTPVVLWLTVLLCAAAGLPVRLSGFLPTLLLAVLASLAFAQVSARLLGEPLDWYMPARWPLYLMELGFGAFTWYVILGLFGHPLRPTAPGIVAIALFTVLFVGIPGAAGPLGLLPNLYRVAAVILASQLTDVALTTDGPWPYVSAVLLATSINYLVETFRKIQESPI